jgi:hypothetical protein
MRIAIACAMAMGRAFSLLRALQPAALQWPPPPRPVWFVVFVHMALIGGLGGSGSGRYGGRPTTGGGLTLNLSKLLRDGFFRTESCRAPSVDSINQLPCNIEIGPILLELRTGKEARTHDRSLPPLWGRQTYHVNQMQRRP